MINRDHLARLHFVNAVLDNLTGHDLYLASQLLEGIEAANTSIQAKETKAELGEQLRTLHNRLLGKSPESGFAFCDASPAASAGPLFVRSDLVSAVRRNAPRRKTTVVVANVPGEEGIKNRYRVSKRQQRRHLEHADTVSQLRAAAAKNANPRSILTVLFV